MRHQRLLLLQHLWKPHLLPLRPPQPTLLQRPPLPVRSKLLPVLLLTPLLQALPMLPKPLPTLLLKPPKLL